MKKRMFCTILAALSAAAADADWIKLNVPVDTTESRFYIQNNNIFKVNSVGFVFQSNDNQKIWTKVNSGLTDKRVTSLAASSDSSVIYAGTDGDGIFVSLDSGRTWTEANEGLSCKSVKALLNIGYNKHIWAATFGGGIFQLADNGKAWNVLDSQPPNPNLTSLAMSGNVIYIGTYGNGVYECIWPDWYWIDYHFNAISSNFDISSDTILSLSWQPANYLFAWTKGGGYFEHDSWGWYENTKANTSLVKLGDNILYAYQSWTPVYMNALWSPDNGASWVNVPPEIEFASSFAVIGNRIFAGSRTDGIFQSLDNGKTWTAINSGLTSINRIASLEAIGNTLYAFTILDSVFRSIDYGMNWTPCMKGLQYVEGIDQCNKSIYGKWNTYAYKFTDDSGWVKIADLVYPTCMAENSTTLFAGTEKGLSLSTNKGANWGNAGSSLPALRVTALLAIGNAIFAGMYGKGLYFSSNNGASWSPCNAWMTEYYVWSLGVIDSFLLAGTSGGMVWKKSLREMNVAVSQQPVKDRIESSSMRISPRPGAFAIHFTLAQQEYVTLAVSDLAGRTIATIAKRHFNPGQHTVSYNYRNLPAGCHLVTLKAGNLTHSISVFAPFIGRRHL